MSPDAAINGPSYGATVRPLAPADLTVIARWYVMDAADWLWLKRLADDPLARVWVWSPAAAEPEPRGVAWFRLVAPESELIDLRIAPEARGQGGGTLLMQRALDALQSEGIDTCHLEVRVSNGHAQRLYRGLGFVESGYRRDYYRSQNGPEDAMLMCWQVGERTS